MKRILFAGLLAVAIVGLTDAQASAICFDKYKPCISLPLPRIPIFCPKLFVGCDPEGRQHGCGLLLYNRSVCMSRHCHPGACPGNAFCVDCARPMYPNPGLGYQCYYGAVGPWYNYFPPSTSVGYQVGPYGGFRGPAAPPPAPFHGAGSMAYNNVPSYWYGR